MVKVPLHSTGDATRLAALLIAHLCPTNSLFPPCDPGASPVSVRRGTFTTVCYALAHHGRPRATGDLDVWVDPTADNAPRVIRALETFGAPLREVCRTTALAQVWSFRWACRLVASTS